jgi:hypothetical protein
MIRLLEAAQFLQQSAQKDKFIFADAIFANLGLRAGLMLLILIYGIL